MLKFLTIGLAVIFLAACSSNPQTQNPTSVPTSPEPVAESTPLEAPEIPEVVEVIEELVPEVIETAETEIDKTPTTETSVEVVESITTEEPSISEASAETLTPEQLAAAQGEPQITEEIDPLTAEQKTAAQGEPLIDEAQDTPAVEDPVAPTAEETPAPENTTEPEPELSAEEAAAYAAEQAAAQIEQAAVAAEVAAQANAVTQISSGSFVGIDAGHDASGNIRILEKGDDIILEFQGNFATSPGPDLYVYISQPQSFGPQSKKGADVSRMKLVSALSSTNGAQMYKISKADWEAYGASVVIWCRAFGYLFGYANL